MSMPSDAEIHKVAEAMELVRKLRESGLEGPAYEIASPYQRRRFTTEPRDRACPSKEEAP